MTPKEVFTKQVESVEEQILLGGILGDGCVFETKNKCNSLGYYESHSSKQKNYLLWKNTYLNFNFHENKGVASIRKEGKLKDFLEEIRKSVYADGKKRKISSRFLSELNLLGILVWYLDDGNLCYPKIEIATDCFDYNSQLLFKKYFYEKFGIEITLKKQKNYFKDRKTYVYATRLVLNKESLIKFVNLLTPIFYKYDLPKDMFYKLDIEDSKRKSLERDKKYYLKNKDTIKKRALEYHHNNKKKCNQKSKEYRLKNRKKMIDYGRKWWAENKDRINKRRKKDGT